MLKDDENAYRTVAYGWGTVIFSCIFLLAQSSITNNYAI
jgi:hypothetical protein